MRAFQFYYDPEPCYADIKNPSLTLMVRAFNFLDNDHLLPPKAQRRILVSPNKRLSLHAALPLFLIRNNLTGGSYSEKGKTPSPIFRLSASTQ